MRILVTGGCGYIGSVLVPQLLADEAVSGVVVLDSFEGGSPRSLLGGVDSSLDVHRGDVRDLDAVERAMQGVDRVVHLAAVTGADSTNGRREETFEVNLRGTEHVATAAGNGDVDAVVLASSCNIYGRAASRDIDEETAPDPRNPYAESKIEAERALRDAAAEYGFDATALRMSTNYGYASGVRFNLVVNHFVFRGVTDRPLTVYGDGENWRPFVHVRDAANAFKHAVLNPHSWPADVYNVGSPEQNYRIKDIARIVTEELEFDLRISFLEEKRPGPSYHVNFDRLRETGYEPDLSVREGVQELVDRFHRISDVNGLARIQSPVLTKYERN